MASQVCQNYYQDCEDAVNKQINMELYSSYLCDFLETHYLDEQVKMIKKLGDHITNLKRLGAPQNGMGEIKMASQVHQNYHQDCEDAVNKQINMELYSSLMSFYFDRDDVALCHFAEFFKGQSHENLEHAEKLMEFQNRRGGRIILADIKKPEQDEWSNGLEAMQRVLQMEKNANQSLLDLHKLSTGSTDPHLCDFLETNYLDEQVKIIKKLGDHITNLKRLGAPENGLGEYLFDKHTLGESDSTD
uniref:ferritin, higher subunit-like n=1 Tax=Pristiophorus japonicus TaxID=55135 RepID=UPI00398EA6D8